MTFVIRPSVFFLVFFANTEDNEVDCHGSVKPGNRSFGYFSRPLLEGEKGQVIPPQDNICGGGLYD